MLSAFVLKGSIRILSGFIIVACIAAVGQSDNNQPAGNDSNLLPPLYQKWLDEDVHWIVTAEEAAAFRRLRMDKERDEFVEQFWKRRDPTPGTPKNEYKEEHYRRLAYANTHFASTVPGWKTDRGRTYITLGPPDAIETPRGSSGEKKTEVWVYKYLEGIGSNVAFKFVDVCDCGDYRGESVQSK